MARSLIPALAALAACTTGHAAVLVDWWTLDSSDRSRFLSAGGATAATLEINTTVGILPDLFPMDGEFADAFWESDPGFVSLATADATLPTTDVLVVPPAEGGFSYTLAIEAPALGGHWLAIGGLFSLGQPSATLRAFDASDAPVTIADLIGLHAWDAGFVPYDGPLVWDSASATLLPLADGGSESAFAFFELPAADLRRIEITVSSPSFPAPGDPVSFAIGQVIPEPSAALLSLAGALVLASRRARARLG